jgi:hypothetical protein
MLCVEGPKHLSNRAAPVDELVNHILKVFLAMTPSEKFFPDPRTEESGVRDSKFFIGHDFVFPRSLPWVVYIRSASFFLTTTPSAVSRCFLNAFRFLSTMVVFARTSAPVA